MKLFLLACLLFPFYSEAETLPVRVQLSAEPNTLDPFHVSDVLGFNLISNVAEGLFRMDGSGKLVNAWAESYKISKDGLTYRFRIRKGKWSDGQPLHAKDFTFGLRHALDPKTAARDASMLQSIAEISEEGGELKIRLKQADPSFLQALTMPLAAPLRPDSLREGAWIPTAPSSGPYQIVAHKLDREIRFEPNPNHPAKPLSIQFIVVPEETTALNLFETGKLDILTAIPSTEISRLEKLDALHSSPSAASFYLSFNLNKAPFDEVRWRKALAGAVDRESLARLQPKSFSPTTSYLPASIEGSSPLDANRFKEDIAWAQSRASNLPEVPLVYASTALSNLLLQRLQNDVEKVLGLKLKLEPMEWKAYLGRLQGSAPSLFYMGYSATFNDPIAHLKVFHSAEPDNRSHYKSQEFDKLLALVKSTSGKARLEAVKKANALLTEKDVVIVPLLERRQLHGLSKKIKGFAINPYGVMDMRELRR